MFRHSLEFRQPLRHPLKLQPGYRFNSKVLEKMTAIVLFALLTGCSGAGVSDVNRYMDRVLGYEMADMISNNRLDPMRVAPYHTKLGAPGTLSAEMRIVNITGLKQIRRQGDCSGPRTSGPFQTTISCNAVIDNVAVSATSDLSYMRTASRPIGTRADFDTIRVHVEVTSTLRKPTTVNPILLGTPSLRVSFFVGLEQFPPDSVIRKGYEQELSGLLEERLREVYLLNLVTACRAVPFPY
ncbi:hypothetical protein HPB50_023422 [Hyalomma asiaticum]|uniref:Uncharacterized protein n=1 Tax=Hyalomma asiaticum TaxID=266040 RepID=A0ACB7TQ68_HYAAI|nr:hypothetical protein HPB50_023422 [Hyalomma asiaticum]